MSPHPPPSDNFIICDFNIFFFFDTNQIAFTVSYHKIPFQLDEDGVVALELSLLLAPGRRA